MTYNVFGGTLSLTQSSNLVRLTGSTHCNWHGLGAVQLPEQLSVPSFRDKKAGMVQVDGRGVD